MSTKVKKNGLINSKKKNSFLTIDVKKLSLHSTYKNLKLSNKKNTSRELTYSAINSAVINSKKNKNKLIIPNLVNTINLEKRKKQIIKLRNFPTLKLKNFGNSFINSNYFDINNNNYFVNLYNTSIPKTVKRVDISKRFNTKENKHLVNKVKYLNLTNLKKNINFHMKTKSFERKKYSLNNIKINESDKKMKNYRNKLLLEFMKHFKNTIFSYLKKYFNFLRKQILSIRKSGISTSYIYKKKLNQISKIKDNHQNFSYNNSSKKIYQKNFNNKVNMKYSNISKNIGKNVINKIMCNQSKDILNDEVRNIFLDSNNLAQNNFLKKKININKSYKRKILKKELKLNGIDKLKMNKSIRKGNEKIHIRFNHKLYIWDKKKNKKKFSNISIEKYVVSFSLICNKDISDFLETRKNYINRKRKNLILSSILEVEEKISNSNHNKFRKDNI